MKNNLTFLNLFPKKYRIYIILLLFLVFGLFSFLDKNLLENKANLQNSEISESVLQKETLPENTFLVVSVIDGDTIKVKNNEKVETIRLVGIDTPEIAGPRKKIECFGKEASLEAKKILLNQKVFLEQDESQGNSDKYGRLLRYVFLENGESFNAYMIKNGFAKEYTYNKKYKYQDEYKKLQEYAKDNNLGIWRKCD
jgi:micrococcal nuclease